MLEGCPDDGPAMAVDARGGSTSCGQRWSAARRAGAEPDHRAVLRGVQRRTQFSQRQRIPTEGLPHHPRIVASADGTLTVAWDELARDRGAWPLRVEADLQRGSEFPAPAADGRWPLRVSGGCGRGRRRRRRLDQRYVDGSIHAASGRIPGQERADDSSNLPRRSPIACWRCARAVAGRRGGAGDRQPSQHQRPRDRPAGRRGARRAW